MSSLSINSSTKAPSFRGHQILTLEQKLPRGVRPKLIREIKHCFGEGLVPAKYDYKGKTFNCNTFIGFNTVTPGKKSSPIKEVIFANGSDTILSAEKSDAESYAKFQDVDNEIYGRLKALLKLFKIDPKTVLKQEVGDTGGIIKDGDKIIVNIEKSREKGYLAPQTWYEYKKVGDTFEYAGVREVKPLA